MNPPLEYLLQNVKVTIDRPLGSKHPEHDFIYKVNYGYIPGTLAPDGEELDAYVLGTDMSLSEAEGKCIAIIHRLDDDDDKLIVSLSGEDISNEDIIKLTNFQEKWFKIEIIRN